MSLNLDQFEQFSQDFAPQEYQSQGSNLRAIPDDIFPVPNDMLGYIKPANKIFSNIAELHVWFNRGGVVHEIMNDQDSCARLCPLEAERAISELERMAEKLGIRIARLEFRENEEGHQYPVWRTANMPKNTMGTLLKSNAALEYLPEIRQLPSCPVIIETTGSKCQVLAKGYHSHGGGTYITHGIAPLEIPIESAREALLELHKEFLFGSQSDLSRAIAVMLSPALKMGGFIKDDFPMHVAEALESQSGKDYLQKLHSRIYNERPSGIAPPKGGVGSIDETLSKRMIEGRPFITFSNFRGVLESAVLESAIRGLGKIECRALRVSATVDCTPFIWQLSTNGADFTRDISNRSIVTRIRKQPSGFNFKSYKEGDLLAHVEARQPFYLGCVFAIIREWVAQGKQRSTDTRHDFRAWTQSLDWIVQNLFNLPPLLDGHEEIQTRVANPSIQWLRTLAHSIIEKNCTGNSFTSMEIGEFCEDEGIEIPGRAKDSTEGVHLSIGRVFKKLFKEAPTNGDDATLLMVDGINVMRKTEHKYEGDIKKPIHYYSFAQAQLTS
jgi:hypothetical protein